MNRRTFVGAAVGAGLASGSAGAAKTKSSVFELRILRLRNSPDNQRQRLSEFFQKSLAPAARRAGLGPIGVFSSAIAPDGPFLAWLWSFPSLAAFDEAGEKLAADKQFAKEAEAFNALPGLSYVRLDSSLLRGFDSMPAIEAPPTEGRRAPRIFELRTYESNNSATLRRKMKMFDDGEIGIFRRLGMAPVFFGQTIVGRNMPSLVYMLGFDDLASREKLWRAFGADPEWQKMRATPGLSDAEIVSNISSVILSPLPFSDIR